MEKKLEIQKNLKRLQDERMKKPRMGNSRNSFERNYFRRMRVWRFLGLKLVRSEQNGFLYIPFCACIKLVLPQAALLEKLFFVHHIISWDEPPWGTWFRTLPIYNDVRNDWKWEEKSPPFDWIRTHNRVSAPKACARLLWYHPCPIWSIINLTGFQFNLIF